MRTRGEREGVLAIANVTMDDDSSTANAASPKNGSVSPQLYVMVLKTIDVKGRLIVTDVRRVRAGARMRERGINGEQREGCRGRDRRAEVERFPRIGGEMVRGGMGRAEREP